MLELVVGSDFLEAPVPDDGAERWIFTRSSRSRLEVVAASATLARERVIGDIPGTHLSVNAVAAHRESSAVYAAGEAGIFRFDLQGGAASVICGHPEPPAITIDVAREIYGARGTPVEKSGTPAYAWLFEVARSGSRLFALSLQEGAVPSVVEVDLLQRRIVAVNPIKAFCGGVVALLDAGFLALPHTARGPLLMDLSGKLVAQLRDHAPELASAPWLHAAFRESDCALAIASQDRELFRWDWPVRSVNRITHGEAPAWAADGSLYFMRGSTQLWRLSPRGEPELIVRAKGDADDDRRSGVIAPRICADGRYVFAQLTVEERAARQAAVVVDVETGRLQQLPAVYLHTFKPL